MGSGLRHRPAALLAIAELGRARENPQRASGGLHADEAGLRMAQILHAGELPEGDFARR